MAGTKKISEYARKWLTLIIDSTKRFLFANVFSFAFFVGMCLFISGFEFDNHILFSMQMTFFIMLIASANIRLFLEKYQLRVNIILLELIANVFSFIGTYLLIDSLDTTRINSLILIVGIIIMLVVVFVIVQARDKINTRFLKLFLNFCLTLLLSIVLFLAGYFLIFSLNLLFGIEFSHNIYEYYFAFVFAFIWPVNFLAYYPKLDSEDPIMPVGIRIILFYILMPILLVYTVILYVYSAKLLIEFSFPNQVVAPLVTWYLLVSFVVVFYINFQNGKNEYERWVNSLLKFYIPILILPILLLIYSLSVRVYYYGFTIPRYLMFAIVIFITVSLAFMYFVKRKVQSLIALIFMTIVAVSFFGYFSCYDVSIRSQKQRAFDYANKNELLVKNNDGKYYVDMDKASDEQAIELYNIYYYLDDYGEDLDIIKKEDLESAADNNRNYYNEGSYSKSFDKFLNFSTIYDQPMEYLPGKWLFAIDYYKNDDNVRYLETEDLAIIKFYIEDNKLNFEMGAPELDDSWELMQSYDLIEILGIIDSENIDAFSYGYKFEYKNAKGYTNEYQVVIIPSYANITESNLEDSLNKDNCKSLRSFSGFIIFEILGNPDN